MYNLVQAMAHAIHRQGKTMLWPPPKPSMFPWCVAMCTYVISHTFSLKCLCDATAEDRRAWELRCCNALQLVKHMRLTIKKRP